MSIVYPQTIYAVQICSFLNRDDSDYDILPGNTKLQTRKDVRRVSDDGLHRVLDEFPLDRALPDQCALWIHAIAGGHFFPDTNHRTSIATLRELLRENQASEFVDWPQSELIETVKESKRVRRRLTIDGGSLFVEDELYEHWLRYFESNSSLPTSTR